MREEDFAERAVTAIERLADALEVIVGVFIRAEPDDEPTDFAHAEHETPQ